MKKMRQAGPVELPPLATQRDVYVELTEIMNSGLINEEATPGVPFSCLGRQKGDVLESAGDLVRDSVLELFNRWSEVGLQKIKDMTIMELIDQNLSDPTMAKIKQEPHTAEKLQQERYRLYFAMSIRSELMERLLYQRIIIHETNQWRTLPVKPGVGFTDAMMRDLFEYAESMPGGSREDNDGSGYDWSERYYAMVDVTEARIEAYDIDSVRANLMRIATLLAFKIAWMLSDGTLLEVFMENGDESMGAEGKEWLVWKSGLLRTANENSWARIYYADLAALRLGRLEESWAFTMGDDCVESDLGRNYAQFGLRITDRHVTKKGEPFEFCSHSIRRSGRGMLIPWSKTLFRLLSNPPNLAFVAQFRYEMRHNPELVLIEKLLKELDYYKNLQVIPTRFFIPQCKVDFGVCALPDKGFAPGAYIKNFLNMKKAEKKAEKKVEKKVEHAIAKAEKGYTASRSGPKQAVIKKPDYAIGSKREYGTPYNALNSTMHKFMPSSYQAALMAWAHTVANPRILSPHPPPVLAAAGSSPAEARMYQLPLKGTAVANATGYFWIVVNADGWVPATVQEVSSQAPVPWTGSQYLQASGQSTPVSYTNGSYVGSACPNYQTYDQAIGGAGGTAGVKSLELPVPPNFIPAIQADTRYTLVSVELRLRPEGAPLNASGDLAIFNLRTQVTRTQYPSWTGSPNSTPEACLAVPDKIFSKQRAAVANWPSKKWLTAVAVPNTVCCLGQWYPLGSTAVGPGSAANGRVGLPSVWAIGKGLAANTPVEFEVVYNYALYGIRDYETLSTGGSDPVVASGPVEDYRNNGMSGSLTPTIRGENADHRATAAAMRSEQMAGRAPDGPGAGKMIAEGIKGAKDIIEEVTGSSIGELIAEGAGFIASML